MIELTTLVLLFERDWEPRYFPYIGQLAFMGICDRLLRGYNCKSIVEFCKHYRSPEAQIKMGKVLQGDGHAVERFDELQDWTPPPSWCLPSEGWRTAQCLKSALASERAASAGLLDIIGPMSEEASAWFALMSAAVESDIRFQVTLQELPDPPLPLRLFVEQDFAEVAAIIRQTLEEAGIEITTDKEEDDV